MRAGLSSERLQDQPRLLAQWRVLQCDWQLRLYLVRSISRWGTDQFVHMGVLHSLDCSQMFIFAGAGTPPWRGPGCEVMAFKPVELPQGYGMAPNLTSWGGGAIYDKATRKYHSYISAMTNDCLLDTWTKNSRIEHGVADVVTGPYEFVDVAVPTWSHNAAPIALHDGSFAIVHIGDGNGAVDGGQNCTCERTGSCPPPPPPPLCAENHLPGYRCYAASCASENVCTGNHCDCGKDIGEPKLAPCHNKTSCAGEASQACDADPACELFALLWAGGSAPVKLFSNKSHPVANSDWTAYVKIGSSTDLLLQQQQQEQAEETQLPPRGGDHSRAAATAAAGSTIHVSDTLAGPWRPLAPNTLGGLHMPPYY